MKHNKLWRTFLAVSISALAFPVFVQSQTSGGLAPSEVKSPHADMDAKGAGETSEATGSVRTGEGANLPSSSGVSSMNRPGSSAMTDQAMTEADLTLNQKIRQQLISDSSLEASSRNVHFKTDNGQVTLQGTVATEKEKQDIEAKVERIAGVKDVNNQLQIAPISSSASDSMGSSASR